MKTLIILVFLIWPSLNAISQRLSLNELVNNVYSNRTVLGTDSLMYVISDSSPFIEIKPKKSDNIQLIVFKNKEHLIRNLLTEDSYLLQIDLSDIYCNKLVLILKVYIINKQSFSEKNNFLIFYDERKVECMLNSKKEWIFGKTVSIKNHLSD